MRRSLSQSFAVATRVHCLTALVLASFPDIHAQPFDNGQIHFRYATPFRAEFLLPETGPGAAYSNPAWVAETENIRVGLGLSVSGASTTSTNLQASASLPRGLGMGLGWMHVGSSIHRSNAVFLEYDWYLPVGYRIPLDESGETRLDLGLAPHLRMVNSFGEAKVASRSPQIGAMLITRSPRGTFHFGAAVSDILPLDMTLQGARGEADTTYRLYQWNVDASAFWTVPGDWLRLGASAAVFSPIGNPYPDSGLGRGGLGIGALKTNLRMIGAELRPRPWVGLKFERLWNSYWAGGLLLKLKPLLDWNFDLQANATQGEFLAYQGYSESCPQCSLPPSSGWIWAASLTWGR